VSARIGLLLWTFATGSDIESSSPAIANGIVYIGTFSEPGKLFALNTGGSVLWSADTGFEIEASPTVADGMVFLGSLDKNVYAFALDAGNNAVYRRGTPPPRFESLQRDLHLEISR
jgi:outer membrane protein assembly factor BamB